MTTRTRRQYSARQVYDAIVDHFAGHDYPPSIEQVREAAGIRSKATAKEWVHRLRGMGLVDFDDNRPRTLRILKPWSDADG